MFPRLLWTRVGLVVAHHIFRWLQSSVVAVLAALPKSKEPPKINVYAAPGDGSDESGAMDALIKKGVHFAVCQMASRHIAGRIAQATGGETDAILKEIGANLVPNGHFVSAGIVAVNRAQEKGYSFALGI